MEKYVTYIAIAVAFYFLLKNKNDTANNTSVQKIYYPLASTNGDQGLVSMETTLRNEPISGAYKSPGIIY